MRIGRLEVRWLRSEAPHKELGRCGWCRAWGWKKVSGNPRQWAHRDDCPTQATDARTQEALRQFDDLDSVPTFAAPSRTPSDGPPAACTCPPSWEEYMEKIAPEYRHCDNILYGRTCPLASVPQTRPSDGPPAACTHPHCYWWATQGYYWCPDCASPVTFVSAAYTNPAGPKPKQPESGGANQATGPTP